MLYTTKQFFYHKAERKFVCEASEIGWKHWPEMFLLRSAKTGKIVKMIKYRDELDEAEGELIAVQYVPADYANNPKLNWKVVVAND